MPLPLACRVSAEKSAVNLMGVPLYVICHFSLVAFNNFSLSLILFNLITMCLGMFLLWFILPGTLSASWISVAISFPMLGNFLTIICLNIFSSPFSISSPSGTPRMGMFVHLMLSQRSLGLSSLRLFQDGRVEIRVLTPSSKSTKITTNCWTIISRKTL